MVAEIKIEKNKNYLLFEQILRNIEENEYTHAPRELEGVVTEGEERVVRTRLTRGRYMVNNGGTRLLVKYQKKDDEDTLHIECFTGIEKIHDYLKKIYREIEEDTNMVLFFPLNEENKWGIPFCRDMGHLERANNTPEMETFINDVEEFRKKETKKEKYLDKGHPYRRGYLLMGIEGTGKTKSVNIVAREKRMNIYPIDIGADGMDNKTLINRVNEVPPNSVILIDEFDKKFATISKRTDPHVDEAGILEATDGVGRLSEGTIIIITATTLDKIKDEQFKNQLLRRGRIDKTIEYVTQL